MGIFYASRTGVSGGMTREKAIELLSKADTQYADVGEALEMAIKALEQREIIYCGDCHYGGGQFCRLSIDKVGTYMKISSNFFCGDAIK